MKSYIISRTVETGDSATTTTVEAPTMKGALAMMQVIQINDAKVAAGEALEIAGAR